MTGAGSATLAFGGEAIVELVTGGVTSGGATDGPSGARIGGGCATVFTARGGVHPVDKRSVGADTGAADIDARAPTAAWRARSLPVCPSTAGLVGAAA